jgi:hypothetical protein
LERSLKSGGQYLMEAISKTVAITGINAFLPGKAVFSLKLRDAKAIPKKPNQGRILIFFFVSGMKRRSAPKPNSHARVGSE